jgi:hypothetical protein
MYIYLNPTFLKVTKRALWWEIIEREEGEKKLYANEWPERLIEMWSKDTLHTINLFEDEDLLDKNLIVNYNAQALSFFKILFQKISETKDCVNLNLREVNGLKTAVLNYNSILEINRIWWEYPSHGEFLDDLPPFFKKLYNWIKEKKWKPEHYLYYFDDEHEVIDKILNYLDAYIPEGYQDMRYFEEIFENN